MLPENSMWLVCLGKGIGTDKDDYSTGKGARCSGAAGCNRQKDCSYPYPHADSLDNADPFLEISSHPKGELIRKSHWLNQAVRLNL
jgi:hypothetical protein